MKSMPQIQKFMTALPHTIGRDIPIDQALSMMREYRIRHLPVQDGGRLVGVLTDRDLKLATSFGDIDELLAGDVMTQDPYTVSPETPLDHVLKEMAEHKYGSVIVQQQNGKVVGIFTSTDCAHAFSGLLATFYKERPESEWRSRS